MKLVITKDDQAMSEAALHILLGSMYQDKRVNISLTSGRSPKTLYKLMTPLVKDNPAFNQVHYYLFDDSPINGKDFGSNYYEMQELFFEPAHVEASKISVPTRDNWQDFDALVDEAGGIDVMLIGLGFDGHFCGNLPNLTPLDAYTYTVTRQAMHESNPVYGSHPDQPLLITMGPQSLMRVKHLVMIVNGKEKAEILKRFLEEPISGSNPSTLLRLHPNMTVIVDQDAASLLNV